MPGSEEQNKSTTDFLLAAIADSQSTIRALDAKASVLLALLFVPAYAADTTQLIFRIDSYQNSFEAILHPTLACAFSISWLLALAAALSCLTAIGNPSTHIRGTASGFFYLAGEFRIKSLRNLFSTRGIQSVRTVDELIAQCPSTDEEIIADLVFEKAKVSYIRDLKSSRLHIAFMFTAAWIGVGLFALLSAGR